MSSRNSELRLRQSVLVFSDFGELIHSQDLYSEGAAFYVAQEVVIQTTTLLSMRLGNSDMVAFPER